MWKLPYASWKVKFEFFLSSFYLINLTRFCILHKGDEEKDYWIKAKEDMARVKNSK